MFKKYKDIGNHDSIMYHYTFVEDPLSKNLTISYHSFNHCKNELQPEAMIVDDCIDPDSSGDSGTDYMLCIIVSSNHKNEYTYNVYYGFIITQPYKYVNIQEFRQFNDHKITKFILDDILHKYHDDIIRDLELGTTKAFAVYGLPTLADMINPFYTDYPIIFENMTDEAINLLLKNEEK